MADQNQMSGVSANASARLDRADWLSFDVTTLLALSLYLFTLTPEIELEWSGILTTGAMYGGVGPPAGYPVWTIYSWLFIKLLPFSNPAWRVAVGSAVAGAVSCGLVALMVSRGGKIIVGEIPSFNHLATLEKNLIRGMAGYVAGMALGFSDSLWNEALIPEYETFTVLLFTGTLCLLMRWIETGRRYHCWLSFLLFGLLLTNGQEMITVLPGLTCSIVLIDRKLGRDVSLFVLPVAVLATSITQYPVWDALSYRSLDWPLIIAFILAALVAVTMIVVTRRFGSEWKSALVCAFFLLLGFSTYLYLPIASATNPPVNWAYSRTVEGFLHLISRGQFESIHPTNSFSLFAAQFWALIKQTGREFGWLYIPFAVLPFCFLPWMTGAGRKWMCALVLISICVGPLLEELLNFPTDSQSQGLAELYFFPLRVLLSLFTGMGLMLFATKVAPLGRTKEFV
jgi:hypothetical protein